MEPGDILVSLNGNKLSSPLQVERLLEDYSGSSLALGISRSATGERLEVFLPPEYPFISGIQLAQDRVREVDTRAGGEIGKVEKGDRLIAINGRPVEPEEIAGLIRAASPGEELVLTFLRSRWFSLRSAIRITISAPVSSQASIGGVILDYAPEPVHIRYRGWSAVPAGLRLGLEKTAETIEVFYLLLTGRLGGEALGGPVMIFQVTSYVRGVADFLILLALISINLCLINLLPFPVLDGGHLLFLALEGIIRRPLPERFLLVAQQVGMAVIAVVFILITYRDILRLLGY